jgi:hypothetical protein
MLGMLGMTIGSAAGWWAGQHVGMMTAFFLSIVGSGVGLYAVRRLAADYLG